MAGQTVIQSELDATAILVVAAILGFAAIPVVAAILVFPVSVNLVT